MSPVYRGRRLIKDWSPLYTPWTPRADPLSSPLAPTLQHAAHRLVYRLQGQRYSIVCMLPSSSSCFLSTGIPPRAASGSFVCARVTPSSSCCFLSTGIPPRAVSGSFVCAFVTSSSSTWSLHVDSTMVMVPVIKKRKRNCWCSCDRH